MEEIKLIKPEEVFDYAEKNKITNLSEAIKRLRKDGYYLELNRGKIRKPTYAKSMYKLIRKDKRWLKKKALKTEVKAKKKKMSKTQQVLYDVVKQAVVDAFKEINIEPKVKVEMPAAVKSRLLGDKKFKFFCQKCFAGFQTSRALKLHNTLKHEKKSFWFKLTPEQRAERIKKMRSKNPKFK